MTMQPAYAVLALAADSLDDLEKARCAAENRLRQLTRSVEDKDGEVRGLGLDDTFTAVVAQRAVLEGLCSLEKQATLNLQRTLRKHPLGPWVKNTVGVGEKQGARLLAAIGDPYWNTLYGRPRTVSELWAYTGLHVLHTSNQTSHDAQRCAAAGVEPTSGNSHTPADTQTGFAVFGTQATSRTLRDSQSNSGAAGLNPTRSDTQAACDAQSKIGVAPRRQKGQKINWSNTAKSRAYLVAEACMKQAGTSNKPRSPYRDVYEAGRLKYLDATHNQPCHRCGPAGKPAPTGSPLSDGHKHARALRKVSKEILKDLWRESRRLHGITDVEQAAA